MPARITARKQGSERVKVPGIPGPLDIENKADVLNKFAKLPNNTEVEGYVNKPKGGRSTGAWTFTVTDKRYKRGAFRRV